MIRRYWPKRRQDDLITEVPWDVEILWPAMQPRETTMPRPVVFRERETK